MAYTYVRLYMPGHPLADKLGLVLEHRLVASQSAGRWLAPTEHVHHLNGNRKDNRPENLQVQSNSEHMALHGDRGAVCSCGSPAYSRHLCHACYLRARKTGAITVRRTRHSAKYLAKLTRKEENDAKFAAVTGGSPA